MSGDGLREALARYVAQQQDLGAPPIVLDGLTHGDALAWAARRSPSRAVAPEGLPSRSAASAAAKPDLRTDAGVGDAGLPDDMEALREVVSACTLCGLHETRTQAVFSDGNPSARVMVVGEAPGANEDQTGLPFVGQAGKFLDLLLAAIDLSRADSVYICNVLKCRPPGNRNPLPGEIQRCSPYLHRQIQLVRPEVILAVGTFAAQLLTGDNRPLGKLRGEVHSYQGVPTVVTYHPAALLRNPGWTRPTWDDLQLLASILDGAAA